MMRAITKKIVYVIIYIISIIILIFPGIVGIVSAYYGWVDWHLRQDLAQVGVEADARVQHYNNYRGSCTITYQFSIIVDNNIKQYVGEDKVVCDSYWFVGAPIKIKYIPQNPNRSGIEGGSSVGYLIVMSIFFLSLFVFALRRNLKKKIPLNKPHIKLRNAP